MRAVVLADPCAILCSMTWQSYVCRYTKGLSFKKDTCRGQEILVIPAVHKSDHFLLHAFNLIYIKLVLWCPDYRSVTNTYVSGGTAAPIMSNCTKSCPVCHPAPKRHFSRQLFRTCAEEKHKGEGLVLLMLPR